MKLGIYFCLLLMCITNAFAFIGNTNNGTLIDNIDQTINVTRTLSSTNMVATNMNVKVVGITGKYKFAIYAGNATSPSTLIAQSSELVNPATGWRSVSIPATSITNGQYYWLASWSDTVGGSMYYSTGGSTKWESTARVYGAWPNSLTVPSGGTLNYCIYVTPTSVVTNPPVSTNSTSSVTLAWDPSPDASVIGYRVYYGNASRAYTNNVQVGNVTNAVVTNLVAGTLYYFGATAFDGQGLESDFSNETSYTVPVIVPIIVPMPLNLRVVKKP